MKHLPLYILLAVIALVSMAARTPGKPTLRPVDIEEIRAEVTDPASPYYYPKLLARYEKNETVMTTNEYRILYLGTMFQEDYNPYRRSTYESHVENLTHQTTHTRAELDTLIKYTQLALHDTPFDLSQMNFLIYALRAKGKVNLANIWQYKLNRLLECIVSAGSGNDKEQAWYVIYPRDEAMILSLGKDVKALNPRFVEPYYDCIELTDSKGNTQEYYFNLKTLLEEFNRKHPQ